MDFSLPGSSVHGIFQATVLEWFAISFSRGSSRPRDWTQVSRIVSRRFTAWATRKAHRGVQSSIIFHGILVLISLCTRAGVSLTYSKIYSWLKGYTIFNFHRCYTNWCVCMVNVRVSVACEFSRFTFTWSTDDLRIRLTTQKIIAKLRRENCTQQSKLGEERSEPIYK